MSHYYFYINICFAPIEIVPGRYNVLTVLTPGEQAGVEGKEGSTFNLPGAGAACIFTRLSHLRDLMPGWWHSNLPWTAAAPAWLTLPEAARSGAVATDNWGTETPEGHIAGLLPGHNYLSHYFILFF